jgi:Fe-Mn family superoxide dismutase
MKPGGSEPGAALRQAFDARFEDLQGLRKAFTGEGESHFGSGWVWLIAKKNELSVITTHDAANPLTEQGVTPLLVCDLWEHAYYLDYKNDRAAFLAGFWDHLVDWDFAARQFAAAQGEGQAWSYPKAKVTA